MKLFDSPASPFVRKINVLLRELGKSEAVVRLPTKTSVFDSSEALAASNPLGRLPALEREDGVALYDSRVISTYLNDRFGGSLYPQSARRWETLTLEATGDGIMDSAVSMAYEIRLRPENQRSSAWLEAQWSKISRTVSVLNARWMSHLAGPIEMGQISVACALGYLDFRHGERNWRGGNDDLAKWYETFGKRPSMQATGPEG